MQLYGFKCQSRNWSTCYRHLCTAYQHTYDTNQCTWLVKTAHCWDMPIMQRNKAIRHRVSMHWCHKKKIVPTCPIWRFWRLMADWHATCCLWSWWNEEDPVTLPWTMRGKLSMSEAREDQSVWGPLSRLSKQLIYLSPSLWSGRSSPPHLTSGSCRIPTRPSHQLVQMMKRLTFQAHRRAATSRAEEMEVVKSWQPRYCLNLSHLHKQTQVTPHSQWAGPVKAREKGEGWIGVTD